MKNKILTSILLSTLFISSSFAEENTQSESVNMGQTIETLNNSACSKANLLHSHNNESVGEILEDKMEDYIDNRDLRDRYDYTGSAIGKASFNITNSNFSDGVQLAFEKALIKAQAGYISFISARTVVEKTFGRKSIQGSNINNISSSKPNANSLKAIWKKTLALTNAKLDEKLREQGINPNKFESKREKRKALFSQEMITKSVTKGFGNLSGLLPIKTFLVEKNGNVAVGVVVIYSKKIKGMFEDIKHGNLPHFRGRGGRPSSEIYKNKSGADMIADFGIRVGFGENNKPYILSYGQGSYSGQSNGYISISELAYKQAEMQARSNIVTLIAGQMSIKDSQTLAEKISQDLVKNLDTNNSLMDDKRNITKELETYYHTHAELNITGLKTVKKWRYKIPSTSNKIYGVVIKWSPSQAKTAQKIRDFNYNDYRSNQENSYNSQNKYKKYSDNHITVKESSNNEYLNQF